MRRLRRAPRTCPTSSHYHAQKPRIRNPIPRTLKGIFLGGNNKDSGVEMRATGPGTLLPWGWHTRPTSRWGGMSVGDGGGVAAHDRGSVLKTSRGASMQDVSRSAQPATLPLLPTPCVMVKSSWWGHWDMCERQRYLDKYFPSALLQTPPCFMWLCLVVPAALVFSIRGNVLALLWPYHLGRQHHTGVCDSTLTSWPAVLTEKAPA